MEQERKQESVVAGGSGVRSGQRIGAGAGWGRGGGRLGQGGFRGHFNLRALQGRLAQAGLHKALHSTLRRRNISVEVRVHGGKDLQACILPHPSGGVCAPLLTRPQLSDPATASKVTAMLQGNNPQLFISPKSIVIMQLTREK
jgi:hypothetical protein